MALFGIALIIFSNTENTLLTKFLNIKILSIISISSYSIYLLHRPLFAFFRIYNTEIEPVISFDKSSYALNNQTKVVLIFILLFFSYFQYIFVEKKLPNSRNFYSALITSILLCLIFVLVGRSGNGYDVRFSSQNELVNSALTYQDINKFDLIIANEVCHKTSLKEQIKKPCFIERTTSYRDVIVLGDSHSRLLIKPFSEKIIDNSIQFITGDSCIYFLTL